MSELLIGEPAVGAPPRLEFYSHSRLRTLVFGYILHSLHGSLVCVGTVKDVVK